MATREVSDKVFQTALKVLSKSFGEGYANFGVADGVYKAVPTGHDDLDDVLTKGARGVIQGGLVELFGAEAGGKTSLALRICGNAQKLGLRCCWFDAEASFDANLAKINGCDPTQLVLPELAETKALETSQDDLAIKLFNVNEVLEMIYRSITQDVYGVVVLDSVAGLMPEAILTENTDPNKAVVGEVARAMSKTLAKIAQAARKTETCVIFINQLREKIGEYYADRFHTPGGRAIKHFSQQRLCVEKIGGADGKVYVDEDGSKTLIGHYARVSIVKNRKAPPLAEGHKIEIPIYYREYFPDDTKRLYDFARRLQVITTRNGELTWKEGDEVVAKTEGESSMLTTIRNTPLISRLAKACVAAEKSERNQKLKVPIRLPSTLASLTDQPEAVPETKAETKESKRKKTILTL